MNSNNCLSATGGSYIDLSAHPGGVPDLSSLPLSKPRVVYLGAKPSSAVFTLPHLPARPVIAGPHLATGMVASPHEFASLMRVDLGSKRSSAEITGLHLATGMVATPHENQQLSPLQ